MRDLCALESHRVQPAAMSRNGFGREECPLKLFRWALAALLFPILLMACSGPTGDGNDGHNTDVIDSGDTPQPGTGGVNVHALYDGATEICQVVVDGDVLGNTDENILGLEPGELSFELGDPYTLTLDGRPYHIAQNGDYTTGNSSVQIAADDVAMAQVNLAIEPQHQCVATDCDWPYEGGTSCNGDVYVDPPQWIFVDSTGVLRGSETVTDVVSGVMMTFVDGVFTVTATDDSVIEEWNLTGTTITFTYSNEPFEVAQKVTCGHL